MPVFILMAGIRLLIIFTILPIHEFAHGFAAKKLGDKSALIAGRLTLNPLAHIDPIGAVLIFICGFGWAKPVPVNPRNFKNYRRDDALVALAGPLSNLICAAAGRLVYEIIYSTMSGVGMLFALLAIEQFIMINISLAVFNLLPIYPLDGSHILSGILPAKANAFMYKYRTYIYYGLLFCLIFGVLDVPIFWLCGKVNQGIGLLFFWVEPLMRAVFG